MHLIKTIKKWRYVVYSKDIRIRRLLGVLSLEPIIIISIIANATLAPGIPTNAEELQAFKERRTVEGGIPTVTFFNKSKEDQIYNKRFRNLLLQWIIKNNLSFLIVDQPKTRELFNFLSPKTKLISRATLMRDLKKRYIAGENTKQDKLLDFIEQGGRIALTTDV